MELSEMISQVQDICSLSDNDSVYTPTWITARINAYVKKVARGIMIPGEYRLSPPLPELYTSDTITTTADVGYVALPSDFSRDLTRVEYDDDSIEMVSSFKRFMNTYGTTDTGIISVCCKNGKQLHFRYIPDSETDLVVFYYADPETLVEGDDEPTCIPVQVHEDLIVGEVCRQIFNRWEDGIEGAKVNTNHYSGVVAKALVEMELYIEVDHEPDFYPDDSDYIS